VTGRAVSFSTISSRKWSYDYETVNLNEALLSEYRSAVARTASMSAQAEVCAVGTPRTRTKW